MTDATSPANVNAVLSRWAREGFPKAPSPFRDAAWALGIRCAACGGVATDHGRGGECVRLEHRDKRHGQLESLR